MSDVKSIKSKEDDTQMSREKRNIKFTPKGLEFYIKTCQEKRSLKCQQASKLVEKISALMTSQENVKKVSSDFVKFIKCYQDATDLHESFLSLPLPEEEVKRQSVYFQSKVTTFSDFMDNVKVWLHEAGDSYTERKNNVDDDQVADLDEINPEDSVSNISSVKPRSKTSSQQSRTSSTSSARIKAAAEKAALMERLAALDKKHLIEAQEEKLRKEKEKLRKEKEKFDLETELAATNAKLHVLNINSVASSQRSDGMNSYFERAQVKDTPLLNPGADEFVPKERANFSSDSPVVRPKQRQKQLQMDQMRVKVDSSTQAIQQLQSPSLTENCQNDIVNIMQRQNDITALLVKQNLSSVLPSRNIPVFDGDPLQYRSFMNAFENGVEAKTDNWNDCLHFLEQFTRGQPKDLVHSCQHLPPDQGYSKAKYLLEEHFGNENKIASAYMEKIMSWTPIKGDDVKSLQSFSLFLQGCSNLTQQIVYMKELDLPSNMRTIVLKLPYKLREKWRVTAYELQEQNGHRALFTDLVAFIIKEVKIASDPVFGNIQDPQTGGNSKVSSSSKQRKKGSSFATNVSTIPEARTHSTENKIKSTVLHSCLFCLQRNHLLENCMQFKAKMHRDKLTFIKQKGICFGCLKVGHTSKDCRSRLDCNVCHQKHPEVLHIEQKEPGASSEQTQQTTRSHVNFSTATTQTCGHIGASHNDDAVFSIVAVKVKSQKSNKVVQTYAFLDPGSSGTFCTETLAKSLNLKGKRTNILLRTMNQNKIVNVQVLSGLEVSELKTNDFIALPDVLTQSTMPVSTLNIPQQKDIDQWPHLKPVNLHNINADVELLIGTDASNVLEPWEVINSVDGGPYAVKTKVGWVINGPLRTRSNNRNKNVCTTVTANRISVEHLKEMLVKQYNHDFNERSSEEKTEMSREDLHFMNIVNNSTKLIESHYHIDLPFRSESPSLPNNICVAEQRLQSLRRRFEKDAQYKEEYTACVNNMLQQGHAEAVPADELQKGDGQLWYIPHHGVHHPTKEEDAVQMVKRLTELCSKGGFMLSKWVSNSRTVLMSIPEERRAKEIKNLDLDKDQLPVERVLGLQWSIETDEFKFRMSAQDRPHTRRGILSVVSSLYDPLGILAPFSMPAKLLLQELCRQNLKWDEVIPHSISRKWLDWLKDLQLISSFKVDRCIKPSCIRKPDKAQLHHFSDASQDGYGTVSYLKLEKNNISHVTFILGKARVAPMKQTTIPRLELTAAVLAVRVNKLLQKELQIQLEKPVFWTDSTTVLKYISSETRRFHTFVANRISVIREATDVNQWRYVSSKENPADDASRGMKAEEFLKCKRWINGPEFLHRSEEEWPKLEVDHHVIPADDPEVKRDLTVSVIVNESQNATNYLIHYFSAWTKLKTSVAWFLKLKNILMLLQQKRKEFAAANLNKNDPENQKKELEKQMERFKTTLKKENLTPEDLAKAELSIIQFAQQQKFTTEIALITSGLKTVSKRSSLYKLDPVLDAGVLRVGGRLNKTAMPVEAKHPVILTKDMYMSTLILHHIHQQLGHAGRAHMLSRLRQKYWIINANSAARKIISHCVVCRRNRGKFIEQKMADLPEERVLPATAPFTNVGVDYFGPISVKRGRSLLKRYGVLFTCFTSRAVHLEIAYTLDTDSCINAVRRFICRRGPVSTIRSDNATNFVGANRELKESLAELNHAKIQNAFVHDGIKWNFNIPAASHQGGVWERLLRSIRSILVSVLKEQVLDDEGLQTIFCEVEAILNNRPITKVSDDSNDLESLTPNHLLLLKNKPVLPPGLFNQKDLYVRKRWKQVQYMAELFWKRWLSEYLPLMQERQKWTRTKRCLTPGDVVLIADSTAPRGSWMMAKVLSVNQDAKGLVRSVRLQTKTSVLERPVTKLLLLLEASP
ncbi:uncharacterized protein LOC111609249 isoform X1 [Xiphophorus maculatus]|uniref:uncharacterized protein LOC111609249 isoform X1 n=2 Tax=Xiphophorus maculatus TaxID=8083 RepID=UPI000C6EED46|nr:uncharacterized protein LOC111609249 isoform X1 [Xiphophorus maculatus]